MHGEKARTLEHHTQVWLYSQNQNSFGSGWEIGAFIFPPNRSTLLWTGSCD